MDYEIEHIDIEAPGTEWVEELALMLAQIIYAQMVEKRNLDERKSEE
jgi:hypothetical protein